MPHMWIENSANVSDETEIRSLKQTVYEAAIAADIFPLAGIRIRQIVIDDYIVADAHPDNAFVHIVVRLGIGRDDATKLKAAETMFAAITSHLEPLNARVPLAVAFEVQEMHPQLNFKYTNIREHMAARATAS